MKEIQLDKLIHMAKQMLAPGKGLLAADESFPNIEKRFKALGIESSEENRRAWRELLFTTPGIEQYISGVILFDETIRQKGSSGETFVQILKSKGITPGISAYKGYEAMEDSPNELVTKGIEDLPERIYEYVKLGAKFTKWRGVMTIGENIPTDKNIEENARRLAECAFVSQQATLVPVVEPEVLLDGNHTIERCEEVTLKTLRSVFEHLKRRGVKLEGMILKPNMVLSGKENPTQADVQTVAKLTIRTLLATVPREVYGVAFLSGGQDDLLATARLNEIAKIGGTPWRVTFSFSRGLQSPTMKVWLGKKENVAPAQKMFLRRAKLNSLALQGQYSTDLENEE